MHYVFDTTIATEFNVDIAIFLSNLAYWTNINLSQNKNIYDGRCWTYNSVKAFGHIFPFWTRHQIDLIIKSCIKEDLIIAGNYNKFKFDRTKWYALSDKALRYFPRLQSQEFIEILNSPISENSESTISENSERSFLKNRKPIPYINTDNKPNNNPIIPSGATAEIAKAGANAQIADNTQSRPAQSNIQKSENPSSGKMTISDMQADNPYNIPVEILEDWQENRKAKRIPITKTAWKRVNNAMAEIYRELGITPKDSFERMVESGWQSLKVDYFKPKEKEGFTKTTINTLKFK